MSSPSPSIGFTDFECEVNEGSKSEMFRRFDIGESNENASSQISLEIDIQSTYPQIEDMSFNNINAFEIQEPPKNPLSSAAISLFKRVGGISSKNKPEFDPEDYAAIPFGVTCVDALGKSYIDVSNNHVSSNSLDVLALYIKGQKLLYTEAKTYCEQQLNFLMLPAIFIACVGSIFSFLSSDYSYGPIIIASLNGLNAFILSLISYLKLDAKAQAHKTSAYKFDKLESLCEFNSGKFMFFPTEQKDILDIVNEIETGVKEIKETNQFILPESIRYEFYFTYSTNVFMTVKRIYSAEITETNNLRNCLKHLNDLRSQIDLAKIAGNPDKVKTLINQIQLEETRKTKFVYKIFKCRQNYYAIDTKFNKEIERHMTRVNQSFLARVFCCDWLKS